MGAKLSGGGERTRNSFLPIFGQCKNRFSVSCSLCTVLKRRRKGQKHICSHKRLGHFAAFFKNVGSTVLETVHFF